MCVKLLPRDLNSGSFPSDPTNTYTCEVTTTSRVCGGRTLQVLPYKAYKLI